jgi:hypothetical protein
MLALCLLFCNISLPCVCCIPEIAQSLSNEMDVRFPQHDIIDAFGIIYL